MTRINLIFVLIYDISVIMQCLQSLKNMPQLSTCEFIILFLCIFISNVMCVLLFVKHKFTYFAVEVFFIILSMYLLSLPIRRTVDLLSNQ